MKRLISQGLAAAVLIAAFTRLLNLPRLPPGFTPDEAAFGYNAYSLLLTGRDEWHTPWYQLFSHNLKSFGDYKLPLYSFLAVPSVALFGLNEFSTRLPNALLSVLAVPVIYLLCRYLFPENKHIASLAALFLSISPWHIGLSRGAFEANLVIFFLPLAILLYLRRSYLWFAAFAALNFYTYHTARLITLPVIILLLIYQPLIKKNLVYLFLLLLLCLPGLMSLLSGSSARVGDIAVFHPTDNWASVSNARFAARVNGLPDFVSRIFYNKVTYTFSQISSNYLNYFSLNNLFIQGAGEGTYGLMPGTGLFYLVEIAFIIAFMYLLIRTPSPPLILLISLLFIVPLPAALSKSTGFSANRAAVMLPFYVIGLAAGAVYLFKLMQRYKYHRAFTFGIFFILAFSFVNYLQKYIYLSPQLISQSMLYGREEMVNRVLSQSGTVSQIQVSRTLSEPHIYYAFYIPIPPTLYQQAARSWPDFNLLGYKFLDQYDGYNLGKFRFGDFHPVPGNILYVGTPQDFSVSAKPLFQIDYPTGNPAVLVSGQP